MSNTFDPLKITLECAALIEANAGCGKTWALTDLYLRLILEKNLAPRNILVVSFTQAATDELRDRIRRRLGSARDCFMGIKVDDPLLEEMSAVYEVAGKRPAALMSIVNAISSFDEAAVYTIHGFCLRILADYAFESGSFFEIEALDVADELLDQILDDHYRRTFYHELPEFVAYALRQGTKPKLLRSLVKNALQNPYLEIMPQENGVIREDLKRDTDRYLEMLMFFKSEWERGRDRIRGKILSPALNQGVFAPDKTEAVLAAVDGFLSGPSPHFPLPDDWEKITSSYLRKKTNKGRETPEDQIFCLAQELYLAYDELKQTFNGYLHDLSLGLIARARREAARRREEQHGLNFDDLLLKVLQVLESKNGQNMAAVIRQRYMAALVDEFQDTDEIQYAIFRKLFSEAGISTFYIGDPKQAIYAFRGADVFSYLKAARETAAKYTKRVNRRSDCRLIAAVNRIFSNRPAPFINEDIVFEPSLALDEKGESGLKLIGLPPAPLQIWYLLNESDTKKGPSSPIGRTRARPKVAIAVAGEIDRLLRLAGQGRATIDGRRLEARDIAVLVRKNHEARLMREKLAILGIKSIVYGAGSVYHTDEAQEMGRILAAIAAPGDESRLIAALGTRFFGMDALALDNIKRENTLRQTWMPRFRAYSETAQKHGCIFFFRRLLQEEGTQEKIIAAANGERALTDILHLMELLHQAERERRLTPTGLALFLSQKIREAGLNFLAGRQGNNREEQLRLESEHSAVRIVTIHKSKGLEYPIVFCPFSWSAGELDKDFFSFHDRENDYRPTGWLSAAPLPRHWEWYRDETLAEECRLLYVALTRAKYRSYFVWGRFKNEDRSAAAYLLHNGMVPDEEGFLRDMERLVEGYGDSIHLSALPEPDGASVIHCNPLTAASLDYRRFQGAIDNSWRVTSASNIMTGSLNIRTVEAPDYDAPAALSWVPDSPEDEETGDLTAQECYYSIPRGAQTGTMLHDIIGSVDFTEVNSSITRNIVEEKLLLHGLPGALTTEILTMLNRVTSLPLDGREMRLCSIGKKDRIDEMSFCYPLERLNKELLWAIFNPYRETNPIFASILPRLLLQPVSGFMRGFIDLIFFFRGRYYLVDWKSNFLGAKITDYRRDILTGEMVDSLYVFQYLVYTLAVHQHLELKIPGYRYEEHFGGVYYLFLRGICPLAGREFGVYHDLPPAGLIQGMQRLLGEGRTDKAVRTP